jgi:hypothetical protein
MQSSQSFVLNQLCELVFLPNQTEYKKLCVLCGKIKVVPGKINVQIRKIILNPLICGKTLFKRLDPTGFKNLSGLPFFYK